MVTGVGEGNLQQLTLLLLTSTSFGRCLQVLFSLRLKLEQKKQGEYRLSKNKHNEYYLPIVRSPFPKFPEVSLSMVFSTSLCVSWKLWQDLSISLFTSPYIDT